MRHLLGLFFFILLQSTETQGENGNNGINASVSVQKEREPVTRYVQKSILPPKLCADAIRVHLSVANTLHQHLDFSFREDDNTTMDESAFNIYSLINTMALTLFKLASNRVGGRIN